MTYAEAEYVERFRAEGVAVIPFHPEKKFDRGAVLFIRKTLLEGQFDILHLFNSKAIINGLRAAIGLSVKVVLYRGYTGNVHWYDPTAYAKYLHPRVDLIICNAHATQAFMQRQFWFRKDKTLTINKGHDIAWYADVVPLPRTALALPEEAFVVATSANLRGMKGIDFWLEAVAMLPADLPIHVVLAGHGTDAPEMRQKVSRLPDPGRVHLLGFRKDVLRVVAAADLFVLPSVKGEAITKAVIEAMGLGKAVVITDIPGNRDFEVLRHGSGLVVPPKNAAALRDAVLRCYENRAETTQMGQNARRYLAEVLTVTRTAELTLAAYSGLLGGNVG